ncbi:RagB/SusD family nutrient uptake outer membrane protein [Paradesertivirga mongoliensis]|uniref:RagB/SusD family nutrient uptake outer membrane protein n=1 Tax=Paradesertivirga mongoliensis TaxID=2100740 RepID=A0ABW4ZL88_9SPHI|nr:RagB/SusD family nutrient uptake outer membrane protein [Pedobacter mongoliensis]
MKSLKYILLIAVSISFTQCKKDFLEARSPSSVDDEFVSTTPAETFKILSWGYANYRQTGVMGIYRWNDPIGSDAETYPEDNSSNNLNAILRPDLIPIDAVAGGFNGLYATIGRAAKVASLISEKAAFKEDVAAGRISAWTQLYGEALTMRAFCYFELIRHFGDVPYGYENTLVDDYSLTSRFVIYDNLIEDLKKAEPLMYKIGEGGINAERFSRTYCNALIGQLALNAGGYQTIRTDVPDLYGNVTFTRKGNEANKCVYARRSDYLTYYEIAKTYLQKAIDNKGSAMLITSDGRAYANNPFQRHFQYFADLQVSPESIFELGNIQGGQTLTTSEYPYAFGRPSDGGGSNAAPTKVFGALRIIPTVYYGDYSADDKRRDVSVAVTGSKGDGNEMMLSFVPGNKNTGGIATNKWDDNRMNPPYVASQRNSGINWPMLRMADVILMLAEVKAELGDNDAVALVNQIRQRAFGNSANNIGALAGQALKDAVMRERKLELLGEGTRRWDLIRSGTFSERAVAIQEEMATMINNIQSQGYHRFANGNEIPAYIWTKMVNLPNPLTYDADITNPALYPGWRGQYDYTKIPSVASKVVGTNHNVAIQGLFRFIPETSAEATLLKSQGYVKTNWGNNIVTYKAAYERNTLSGISSAGDPPRYYWPIPSETVRQSKGNITNGYGLAQP